MLLTDKVREGCRSIAESARFVSIDLDRLVELDPGPPPELDADRHYLEGTPGEVADYMLALDTINFGSGGFRHCGSEVACPAISRSPHRSQTGGALWVRGRWTETAEGRAGFVWVRGRWANYEH